MIWNLISIRVKAIVFVARLEIKLIDEKMFVSTNEHSGRIAIKLGVMYKITFYIT